MSFRERFYYYFYSNKNIAGCILAGLGLVAYFTGLIEFYWYLIVPGLYLAGALGMPNDTSYELELRNQVTNDEIKQSLNQLVRKVSRKVPKNVLTKVKSIKESIFLILPYITDINSGEAHIFSIRRTALEYLPVALENYLNLPTAYARFHVVRDGKTATDLLMEQLEILDKEMKDIVIDFNTNNTASLLAHGRFLESKFRESDLLSVSSEG